MNEIIEQVPLSQEHELIALAMLETRGDIAKASRSSTIVHNAMSLRAEVKKFPAIRARYRDLIAEELMDRGLHITERILRMAELQEKAMGCTVMVEGPELENVTALANKIADKVKLVK